ncbi:uncharacterized protein EDB91DRAFT_1249763 [Suillus paluster]|uniref:uncharacterized protein n=1 Tax=Suillus paluster TaxID=48578 RepID=UPI001B864D80|nr:uncharacterized protein EDB91DRAFT_1249763 [Suillus paluster]KAG1737114.1 hypothetical protein EDB91DRAFT_1249763 [Suillus paluster]
MSQSTTVPNRMVTCAKNATQHPGHILTAGRVKRRTVAQKAADDQREQEEMEASEATVQEGYQRIATLQAKMQADEDAARVDAPKPKRPRARAVKKGAKAMETSTLTTALRKPEAGAEITADQVIGTKGKAGGGHGGRKVAASANVEHPASGEELNMPVPGAARGKKPFKQVVRDAIQAVVDVDISIDGSTITKALTMKLLLTETALFFFNLSILNDDAKSPKKFALAGRIPGWMSTIPATIYGPASKANPSTSTSSIQRSNISSSAPLSKLTKGSTMSSNSAPPLTPISTPDPEGHTGSTYSSLFADDKFDDDEPSTALTNQGFTGIQFSSKAFKKVVPPNVAHRDTIPVPDQFNAIENFDNDFLMHSDIDDGADPIAADFTQPTSLVDYNSNSDSELHSSARESDLEPPPLAQKPSSRCPVLVDFSSQPASQKRKSTYLDADDDLMTLSSEVEIMERPDAIIQVKTKPTEPVSLHRLTSATGVTATLKAPAAKQLKSSIPDTQTAAPRTSAASSKATKPPVEVLRRSLYRTRHLPDGYSTGNKWKREFVPTVLRCVGDLEEVWTITDIDLCRVLQSVWNGVYKGKIQHTVTVDGPVISMSLQRLSDWRNALSQSALIVYALFLISQDDLTADKDRQDFSRTLLKDYAFLYGEITDDRERLYPFKSDLILQVLVHHMTSSLNAIDLTLDTNSGLGKGILSLVTAAVERAVKLLAKGCMILSEIDTTRRGRGKAPQAHNKSMGKDSTIPLAFSDANYGQITRSYLAAIERQPESVLLEISELALSIAVKRSGVPTDMNSEESQDERALIC